MVDVIAAKPESSFIERHYMKNLTSEDCTFGINGLDDPETRRYVLPLNVRSNVIKILFGSKTLKVFET